MTRAALHLTVGLPGVGRTTEARRLAHGPAPAPPDPFPTWLAWACDRWPTLPLFDDQDR